MLWAQATHSWELPSRAFASEIRGRIGPRPFGARVGRARLLLGLELPSSVVVVVILRSCLMLASVLAWRSLNAKSTVKIEVKNTI